MKRPIAYLTLAALALAPFAGLGAGRCPVGGDVDGQGVVVDFSDGSRVVYSSTSDRRRILEVNLLPQGGSDFWVESWLGVYPLSDGAVRRGAPDRSFFAESVYPLPLESLPAPAPGASWTGVVREANSRGVSLGETRLTVKFGGIRPLTIGGCAYQAIQVETLFAGAEGGFQGTLDYLPELGVAIQTAGGELGRLLDFYLPVAIRPVAEVSPSGD